MIILENKDRWKVDGHHVVRGNDIIVPNPHECKIARIDRSGRVLFVLNNDDIKRLEIQNIAIEHSINSSLL